MLLLFVGDGEDNPLFNLCRIDDLVGKDVDVESFRFFAAARSCRRYLDDTAVDLGIFADFALEDAHFH